MNPSTATVAPSGMAATASWTEATLTSQHVTAADVDDFARDVAGFVRRQECHHGGDVAGLTHAAQRDLCHLLLADGVRNAARHLGIDEARADRIHRDLRAGQFLGGRPAESHHAGFGGRVVGLADISHPARRRNIHDTAASGGTHDPARGAAHEEDARQVHRDDRLPLFVRHLVQHGIAIDASVVDKDVQPAEAFVDVLHERIAIVRIGHVQSQADRSMAKAGGDTVGIGLIDVGTDDGCSFLSQLASDPLADPAARARNDRDFLRKQVSR